MAAGFAAATRLIDFATSPINDVNKAITGLEKTVKQTARESGLLEVRDALGKVKREAVDVFDNLGSVFAPLQGLTAAGTLAGMAALSEHFASTGAAIGRAAERANIGAQ